MRIARIITLPGVILLTGSSVLIAQVSTPKTTTTVSTAQGNTKQINVLQPLEQMVTNLRALKLTGDPDLDYVAVAKTQTLGTQNLLKSIGQTNPDSALMQTAITMVAATKTDLETINTIQKDLKPTRPNALFATQQKRTIAAIAEKIKQSASDYKLKKDFTKNLYILLGDQRQDAINLATNYLKFGKNTKLRNFAQQAVEKANLDLDILRKLQTPNR